MGCHLYFINKTDGKEVSIPYFFTVPLLEGYDISDVEELRSILRVKHIEAKCNINLAKMSINTIEKALNENTQTLLFGKFEMPLDKYCKQIVSNYHWENNVGFNISLTESNYVKETLYMLKWEVNRIKNHMITEENITELMNIFDPQTMVAITK